MVTIDQILTVIVLYEMKLQEAPAYQTLTRALEFANQSGHLFVYDNSSTAQPISIAERWQVAYRHDPTNPGVSKAYNRSASYARDAGKKWLLLVDQDTDFPEAIFSQYVAALNMNPEHGLFVPLLRDGYGFVSPFKFIFGRGVRLQRAITGRHPLKNLRFVNSGLVISLSVFERARGYDERLPLDFSDYAFIDRLSKVSEHFIVVDAVCHHSLSSGENKSIASGHERFRLFCSSAVLFCQIVTPAPLLWWLVLPRAVKLSLRWRDLRFLKTGFRFLQDGR
jgi:GT2 family glycosyltransferase